VVKNKTKTKAKRCASAIKSVAGKPATKGFIGKRAIGKDKVGKRDYAKEAGLSKKQFCDFIYLIATGVNYEDVDGLISKFYPKFKVEDKCNLLFNNFGCRIVAGKNINNNYEACYGFAIQFILSQSKAFGPESIIDIK